jgi:acyl-coenzyme A synthetase/AMP-(fatty) acid ligase
MKINWAQFWQKVKDFSIKNLETDKTIDGKQFCADCAKFVEYLNSIKPHNTKQKPVILIHEENGYELVVIFFSAIFSGCIPAIVNNETSDNNLNKIISETNPFLVFTGKNIENKATLKSLYRTVISQPEAPSLAFEELLKAVPENYDVAMLIYTSGTTLNPKGIKITFQNILFCTNAIQARLGYKQEDKIGVFLPLSFDYGLYQVFLAINAGCQVVLGGPKYVGPLLLKVLEKEKISIFPGMPIIFESIVMLMQRKKYLLKIRLITSTGEHFSEGLQEKLSEHISGVKIFPMYGLTECKRVSILTNLSKNGSVGKPLDGVSVYIVDSDRKKLGFNQVGEVVVCGDNVAAGYWNPKDDKNKFSQFETHKHALCTGDFGYMDEDGYLYIEGRKDGLIKNRGYRINVNEVVDVTSKFQGVEGCVALKLDESYSYYLCIKSPSLDTSALKKYLKEQLESFKIPDKIVCVKNFPMTQNAKVDRKKLLELAQC